jgi:hypothetical protein
MVSFRIWYVDGTIIDGNSESDWIAAPDNGVAMVAAYYGNDEYGRKLGQFLSGSDWYWMFENDLYHNSYSTYEVDFWVDNPAPEGAISKKGKWTTEENLENIVLLAIEWLS